MRPSAAYAMRFTRGCREGRVERLIEGETTIGRSSSNHIVLPDIMVSRRHARILRCGSEVVIEDRHSRAGTFVNGQRIRPNTKLEPGDRIQLGNQKMRILPAHMPRHAIAAAVEDLGELSRAADRPPHIPNVESSGGRRAPAAAMDPNRSVSGLDGTLRFKESLPWFLAIAAVFVSVLFLIELLGDRVPSRQRQIADLLPAGWTVNSRFVDVDMNGETNEIVLVLRPNGSP